MAIGEKTVLRHLQDGREIVFKKQTRWDQIAICNELRTKQRVSLSGTLKEAMADKGEIVATLREFDEKPASEDHFVAYVLSPEGRARVLLDALGGDTPENRQKLQDFTDDGVADELQLIADICALKFKDEATIDASGKDADDAHFGDDTTPNPTSRGDAFPT